MRSVYMENNNELTINYYFLLFIATVVITSLLFRTNLVTILISAIKNPIIPGLNQSYVFT